MEKLNFLESEKLLKFFHRKKTELSCLENPQTFLRQLRDHDLIPEAQFKELIRMKNKEKTKGAIYDMLDQFEAEQPQRIQDFWHCAFQEIIMDQYPTLRQLHKQLMDDTELGGRMEQEETVNESGEERQNADNFNDAEQPGPSSQRNVPMEADSPSPLQVGEKKATDVGALTNSELPVTCRNLEGILNKGKLAVGKNCIKYKKSWITPPEFEKRAGLTSKNWKTSIRYNGKTLKDLMKEWKMTPPVYKQKPKAKKPTTTS